MKTILTLAAWIAIIFAKWLIALALIVLSMLIDKFKK
jgi:hypothetical protein